VAKSTGELQGSIGELPFILAPQLRVTDTPQFACSNYADQQSCSAQYPYCEWYSPLSTQGRPYCRNR
jgi:hypothetical protein